MDEKENTLLSRLSTKKRYILLLFVILLIILSGALLFSYQRGQKKAQQLLKPSPIPTSIEESKTSILPPDLTKANIHPPPQVFFETYENKAPLPSLPETIKTYTFKTDFSLEEILSLGQKLGLTQQKASDDTYVILYNLTDMNNRGILTFNRETGEFSFQSWGVHKPQGQAVGSNQAVKTPRGRPEDSPEVEELAKRFLSDLGVIDPTVTCPITYQKKDMEGVTFVECHRDWSLVGSPILNFVGVLNIPEGKRLADVSLGSVDENTPEDTSIINVSTGDDGKIRPNDFNTATVAISSDGRILSVNSNLRQIVSTNTLVSTELLTPEVALEKFISHQAQLSLTIPAGSGFVDLTKVYPSNLAQAQKATITDYLLTYLEKPPGVNQQSLVPMYLIRGTASLSSGYTVRFTETVPALKTGLSFLAPYGGSVAGYSTSLAQERTIKLGSFTPAPTYVGPTPTQIFSFLSPTLALPSPTPLQASPNECNPSSFSPIFELPSVGTIGVSGGIFFSITATDQDIDNIKRNFFDLVGEQYAILMSVFLETNPSFIPNSPSYSSLTSLFDDLNKNIQLGKQIGKTAPITLSLWQSWYGIPGTKQEEALNQIVNKTVDLLITALGNNTLNQLASRQNLFPQQVLDIFYATYIIETYPDVGYHGCEYISGTSPSLYLYPQKPTKVIITLGSPLTYTDPAVKDNSWQVTAYPDGRVGSDLISTEGLTLNFFSRLYYEYDKTKVSFTEPKEGFVVKRGEWESFIREKLALKLELAERETEDLIVDIRNALFDVGSSPYLKVSFVERRELDEKLPVEISPKPDVLHRAHLLLTPLTKLVHIPNPKMTRLKREGFTAIEVGVSLR